MKNYFKIGILFLGVLLMTNCSKDSTESVEDIDLSESQNTKLLEILKQWGYNDIKDIGEYYIVEGDMVFDKSSEYSSPDGINKLESKLSKASKSNQRKTPFPMIYNNVNVFLNPGMNIDWINASRSAISRWNNVNSGLNITEVFTAASAHIEIMYDINDPSITLEPHVFGAAWPPTANGLPGSRIWINEDFSFPNICGSAMTQNARIANVQHELGHTVGLHHTNEPTATIIPGTPPSDSGSLMNGGQACYISDFSINDELAIAILFPVPTPTVIISGPTNMGNNSSVTWTYDGNVPNAQAYRWWYKKIGSSGPPSIIAYGSTAYFIAQPDTFYSSNSTSYFDIYLEVEDTNGNRYTSSTVTILKRGKYKLEGGI